MVNSRKKWYTDCILLLLAHECAMFLTSAMYKTMNIIENTMFRKTAKDLRSKVLIEYDENATAFPFSHVQKYTGFGEWWVRFNHLQSVTYD